MKILVATALFSANAYAGWFTNPGFIDQAQLTGSEVQISVTLSNERNPQTSRRNNIKLQSEHLRRSGVEELLLDGKLAFVEGPLGISVYVNKIRLGVLDLSVRPANGFYRVKTLPLKVSIKREGLYKEKTDTYVVRFELSKKSLNFRPNFGFDRQMQNQTGWQRKDVEFASRLIL